MVEQDKVGRLRDMFYPRSVALIGATDSMDRVGYNILDSIITGGFRGHLFPVHPRLETLFGRKVYRSLAEIPEPLDLAIIGLNERATIGALKDCGERGVTGTVCIAGGYRETSEDGAGLERQLRETALRYRIPLIGPNTLGFINNDADLYITFYPMLLPKGSVSFVSQSGGVGLTFLHRAADAGLGINKWIGTGNRSTFEFADYLAFLGQDKTTRVIGLLVEGTERASDMVRVAAGLKKPVVVYKVGRTEAVSFATLTHTGSMAGSHQVYRDIFRQFGLYQVDSVMEMVAALKGLVLADPPRGSRVGIMTHTAGPSIVVADQLLCRGYILPPLSEGTLKEVYKLTGPNPPLVLKNPLDVAALGFTAEPYGKFLEVLASDPGIDLIIAMFCQNRNFRLPSRELVAVKERVGKPIIACYVSRDRALQSDREFLERHGIPLFNTPEEAAWAAAALLAWAARLARRNLA